MIKLHLELRWGSWVTQNLHEPCWDSGKILLRVFLPLERDRFQVNSLTH
jgi:hypothetical protein